MRPRHPVLGQERLADVLRNSEPIPRYHGSINRIGPSDGHFVDDLGDGAWHPPRPTPPASPGKSPLGLAAIRRHKLLQIATSGRGVTIANARCDGASRLWSNRSLESYDPFCVTGSRVFQSRCRWQIARLRQREFRLYERSLSFLTAYSIHALYSIIFGRISPRLGAKIITNIIAMVIVPFSYISIGQPLAKTDQVVR